VSADMESSEGGVRAIMNRITLVPGARTRRRLCCLAALTLALQIPASAFPAKGTDGDGFEMRIRINKTVASSYLLVGDSFTAICVDPGPFSGARIFVNIQSIRQWGRLKGATVMDLSFDRIRFQNGESYPINAEIVRLYDTRSGEQVDAAGDVEPGGRGPQTLKRTGIGALLGGIFGASGNKQVVLDQGVEMLIRVYRRDV
jgi:hypothetical protein